ncbi:rhodanese-like domain-containing protein [Kaistella anthropi]|nr:rhodanese-like domain-containing protein [Kaistella anthropi]
MNPTGHQALTEALNGGAYLVDVRTPAEFSAGSVKGAVNIPLDAISKHLGKFAGKKRIVVFCRSGNRSGQAKRILDQNGINNVIDGGTLENVQQLLTN